MVTQQITDSLVSNVVSFGHCFAELQVLVVNSSLSISS